MKTGAKTDRWRFLRALELLFGCHIRITPLTEDTPEYKDARGDSGCWPEPSENTYIVRFNGVHLVGIFKIRDDSFFYGQTVHNGGNHDWSMTELISSFRNTVDTIMYYERKKRDKRVR